MLGGSYSLLLEFSLTPNDDDDDNKSPTPPLPHHSSCKTGQTRSMLPKEQSPERSGHWNPTEKPCPRLPSSHLALARTQTQEGIDLG